MILSIWFNGPIINFFWMVAMQGNVMLAVNTANKDAGKGYTPFFYWALVNAAATILYALIFTWILAHDSMVLKFIVNSSFCVNMTYFQYVINQSKK
jgi:hypothetical protein